MSIASPTRDPSSVLDFGLDLTKWLDAGDTVASVVVTAPSGITVANETVTDTSVSAWISSGTVDTDYDVVFRWTTAAGRTDERTVTFQVRQR